MMRVLLLLAALILPVLANDNNQVSFLLDAGKTSYRISNSGPLGGGTLDLIASPGTFTRLGITIKPGHVPPEAGTTYTSCPDPCGQSGTESVTAVFREKGQQEIWVEKLASNGASLSPRQISSHGSAYDRNACGGPDTIPQLTAATVTTNPMPMPLEIVALDCAVQTYQFPLAAGHASSSQVLVFEIHNPGYNSRTRADGKISVSINGGTYQAVTNAAVTCIDPLCALGSIGGGVQTHIYTLPITNGVIGSGDTTITLAWRFNGTEGVSSGARILAVNVLEAAGAMSGIVVTSNSAVATRTAHGYNVSDDVFIYGAPGMYMRFNGMRTITAKTANTFTFAPCDGDAACDSPNGSYAPPIATNTDLVAQPVMYAARMAIPKSAFTDWVPDSSAPAGGNATNGATYFAATGLVSPNTPGLNYRFTTGTCSRCHTTSGRDLKLYNYSNNSIIVRTMFHGGNYQNGLDVAACIRSTTGCGGAGTMTVPAKGRPWNPPFQPGPGLSSGTINEQAAGCGLHCVLTYGYADLWEYLSKQSARFGYNNRIETRDIPIPIQFLDWNKWLPVIFPGDGFPANTFLSSTPWLYYVDAKTNITPGDFASFAAARATEPNGYLGNNGNVGLYETVHRWAPLNPDTPGNFPGFTAAGNQSPAQYPQYFQSAYQWLPTRLWEFAVEWKLWDLSGQQAAAVYGTSTVTNWYAPFGFDLTPSFFKIAQHKDGLSSIGYLDGSLAASGYQVNNWYEFAMIWNGGNGLDNPDNPIDYQYLNSFCQDLEEGTWANNHTSGVKPMGYLCHLYPQLVTPQLGAMQPNLAYRFTSAGTDWSPYLTKVAPDYARIPYYWFTAAEWKAMWKVLIDNFNAIAASRTAGYWQTTLSNAQSGGCVNAGAAWGGSSNSACDYIAYTLTLATVWQVDAGSISTLLTFAKSITSWNGHDFDADITAANDGLVNGGCTIGGPQNYFYNTTGAGGWWLCSNMP